LPTVDEKPPATDGSAPGESDEISSKEAALRHGQHDLRDRSSLAKALSREEVPDDRPARLRVSQMISTRYASHRSISASPKSCFVKVPICAKQPAGRSGKWGRSPFHRIPFSHRCSNCERGTWPDASSVPAPGNGRVRRYPLETSPKSFRDGATRRLGPSSLGTLRSAPPFAAWCRQR